MVGEKDDEAGNLDSMTDRKLGTPITLSITPSSGDANETLKQVLKRYPHFIMYAIDKDLNTSIQVKVDLAVEVGDLIFSLFLPTSGNICHTPAFSLLYRSSIS